MVADDASPMYPLHTMSVQPLPTKMIRNEFLLTYRGVTFIKVLESTLNGIWCFGSEWTYHSSPRSSLIMEVSIPPVVTIKSRVVYRVVYR